MRVALRHVVAPSRSALREVPLTIIFTTLLAAAELSYALLPSQEASRAATWASTNVARLSSEPLGPLIASAFVVEDDAVLWLVLAAAALAMVEIRLGWRRTLVVAAAAHVIGSLLSEAIIWWRVDHGQLPTSALHQLDVGASYVVGGVLGAALVVGGRLQRVVAVAGLVALAPSLVAGLAAVRVDAVGHLTAAVVGVVAGMAFRSRTPDAARGPNPVRALRPFAAGETWRGSRQPGHVSSRCLVGLSDCREG